MVGATGAFEQFVYYAGPIVQLLYWSVLIVASLWAVILFKRWVDFQTGAKAESSAATLGGVLPPSGAPEASPSTQVDVDRFVE